MTKLITKGFTNYFSDASESAEAAPKVLPVEILSYDGNKYVEVRLPDGTVEEIKRGYICADEAMTRAIPAINWHILEGGTRRSYRPRVKLTTYYVRIPRDKREGDRPEFKTKAEAVAFGVRAAKLYGEEIEVWCEFKSKWRFSSGSRFVVCCPSGAAVQFSMEGRRRHTEGGERMLQGNYMRGYGKRFIGRPRRR